MAYTIVNNTQTKITAQANVDLSAAQYLFVKQVGVNGQGTPTVAVCSAITDLPLGVLQNAPRATEEAEVVVVGGSKMVASAAIGAPGVVGTDASGRAKLLAPGTDITAYTAGRNLTFPTATGEIFTVLVDCAAPGRAS